MTFSSRDRDDLRLWAVFERPGDPPVSPKLDRVMLEELSRNSAAIEDTFQVLGLT